MLEMLREAIAADPVLLLFLVLGIGYLIGGIPLGSFKLGAVAGVLFAGLLLGHLGFESDPTIQSFGFVLFIFSVGYQAGPGFVQAVRRDGRRFLAIAIIVAVSSFLLAYGLSRVLDFEPGVSAGLLAGALTSTPTLAAADSAVLAVDYQLPLGMSVAEMRSNIVTAYAITYIFGLVGLILIISLLPKFLGIDLAAEAAKLEREEAARGRHAVFSPSDIIVRAIRVESDEIIGRPLREVYASLPVQFTVQKIRRGGELFEPTLETELERGDGVSVIGVLTAEAIEALEGLNAQVSAGTPVRDRELLKYEPESVQICVTNKEVAGVTLAELEIPQSCASFVSRVTRLGVDIEVGPDTKLDRGDVLDVTGPAAGLEALGERLGHLEREVEETDLVTFSWSIVLGLLLGTATVTILGATIGLGSAGGLLALGLFIGYLRSLFPVFGRVPGAARWAFTELGLLLFMASVGLNGGAGLIETLAASGIELVLAGIVVTAVPVGLAYTWGSKVLKMNPLMLFGCITGAMTSGGALNVINAEAKSSVSSIGYTGAYAFANVLLTVAGMLIVLL